MPKNNEDRDNEIHEQATKRMQENCRDCFDALEAKTVKGEMTEQDFLEQVQIQQDFYNSLPTDTVLKRGRQLQIEALRKATTKGSIYTD